MRILNYEIKVTLRSLHKWTHFKLHKHEYYKHLVWGKLSIIFGQPHLTPVHVCSECFEEIQGLNAGDECLSYCEGCNQIEGDTKYINIEEYERIHN